MKKKTYRNGSASCHTYCKNAGNGWEVGVTYGKKMIFIGNFIRQTEATQWYTTMNREIRTFSRRFPVGKTYPKTWFANFLGDQLYRKYYAYLSTSFSKHNREYNRAVTTAVRKYRRMTRQWTPSERVPFLKAA